jgi:hypothetical protein
MRSLICFAAAAALAFAQDKYNGPRPPKPDVLYLVHASTLIPTEVVDAGKGDSKRNEIVYTVAGSSSPARTPLAEPIFIIQSDRINASSLELYRADVKGNKREISISQKHQRNGPRALRLQVTPLGGGLFRVEVDETIENGEYAISPNGSDTVFCFEVY